MKAFRLLLFIGPGVSRVIDADVTYQFDGGAVTIRYVDDDIGVVVGPSLWRIDVDYQRDRRTINERFQGSRVLKAILVRLATPSEDWEPPNGIWNRDVLIQPGTFSNVDGGVGWFGSVSRSTVNWTPSLVALRDLGWEYVGG